MKLKVTFGVLSAVSLSVLVPSRAEAITYYLTGTDTYNCNAGTNACTITYNNFGLEFLGGDWQSPPLSGQIAFSTTGSSSFFDSSSTVTDISSQSFRITSIAGDSAVFSLRSPATGTPGQGINIDTISSTTFFSNDLVATNTLLTGDGLALAVPFVPSLFSLLPIFTLANKKKHRILST